MIKVHNDGTILTLEMLKEHCEETVKPIGKIAFDEKSKTYQEHKMVLDLINEHENRAEYESDIRADERRKFAEWLTKSDYANGYFDTENGFVSVDKVLADYEKEQKNE